jgi:hypothetical protein
MNDRSDQQQLLDDVLGESSPPDFRAALLGETLRLARRRRRWRQARRTAGALAVAVFAALFAWQIRPGKISVPPQLAKTSVPGSCQLIETRPLPAGEVVTTVNFPAVKMVSSESAVTQIATRSGGFRFINDEQLLALVGPRPAVLVRTGPNSEELVFANPEDQKGFPAN